MNKLNIKKGDTVVVISGQDKGKKGEKPQERINADDPANRDKVNEILFGNNG